MGMTIGQAATTLGVSEKTIRRRIKKGLLEARLVGEPPHYEIDESIIGGGEEVSRQTDEYVQPRKETIDPTALGSRGYEDLVDMLKKQLSEKDGQIKELHILLQAAQEQTGRILTAGVQGKRRWWWPFG